MKKSSNVKIENRAASYNYSIEDTLECGIELRGNEVKSIRKAMASIKEAWVNIENSEMYIKQMHITPWETANKFDVDPTRARKLLAHKREIVKFYGYVQKDGYTLVPLKVYITEQGKCKVLVGLCKGKHNYDKRESSKIRDIKRDLDRVKKQYK